MTPRIGSAKRVKLAARDKKRILASLSPEKRGNTRKWRLGESGVFVDAPATSIFIDFILNDIYDLQSSPWR